MPTVAIDVGPLHGHRSGVGTAVAGTLAALRALGPGAVELVPYLVSARARPEVGTRRLPVPAAVAHRWWERSSRPRADRRLGRPDVVHGTNYVVPPARAPRLVSVYDCWFLEHPDEVVPDVARAARLLRRAVGEGAHVVTSSRATEERARELLGTDRVSTVHLGPPEPADAGGPPGPDDRRVDLPDDLRDEPFVLALGTVERRKDVPTLVRAFALLAAEHETVRLVLAGAPGDDAEAVAAAVAALDEGARRRVHLLGAVDAGVKSALLAHATALAYPSLDEGFGFPVLEAQAAGTAVVASSAGSIPEVAGRGALLGLPGDAHALAANLHWVVTDRTRRASLVEHGRANLDRFSWQRTAHELADLYRTLAEEA